MKNHAATPAEIKVDSLSGDWILAGTVAIFGILSVREDGAALPKHAADDVVGQRIVVGIDTGPVFDAIVDTKFHAVGNLKITTAIVQDAALEDAVFKGVTVKRDIFTGEVVPNVIHDSLSVVGGTSTVAKAGGITSAPGGGR